MPNTDRKTIEQCKDEVAQQYKYQDWNHFKNDSPTWTMIDNYMNEVILRYASQPSPQESGRETVKYFIEQKSAEDIYRGYFGNAKDYDTLNHMSNVVACMKEFASKFKHPTDKGGVDREELLKSIFMAGRRSIISSKSPDGSGEWEDFRRDNLPSPQEQDGQVAECNCPSCGNLFKNDEPVAIQKSIKWFSVEEYPPNQTDGEFIGFRKSWIHPDFNPNGTRICFVNGELKYTWARYNDSQDCWITDTDEDDFPTHWMRIPNTELFLKEDKHK